MFSGHSSNAKFASWFMRLRSWTPFLSNHALGKVMPLQCFLFRLDGRIEQILHLFV
jgi:hypothetical protein